jgi:cutinase
MGSGSVANAAALGSRSALTGSDVPGSVCQGNGAGCTEAGIYPGLNALINGSYDGTMTAVWTSSTVQPYSSGVPLYWTAYVTYTNISSGDVTLSCPGSGSDSSGGIAEIMSGGSGDDGLVYASSSFCSENPGWQEVVPPQGTSLDYATFHNVPWPGSTVSLQWGGVGTSPSVSPFVNATVSECESWFVLGLHGLAEGPGYQGQTTNYSPELYALVGALAADAATYGYAEEEDVAYPTIEPSYKDAAGLFNQGPLLQNVQQGVAALQTWVTSLSSFCPGSRISLFGYSEGAWIINVWEQQYADEASQIFSAGLIGDPCYADSVGDAGLARLFTGSCGPADDYIAGETNIQPTNSDCLTGDPVCGVPYLGSTSIPLAVAQLGAAVTCAKNPFCAHCQYAPGEVANMALWMLSDTT